MSSLSTMSAQEITDLLDEYGIKHGPVVASTRSLYEKKLREAMDKGKRGKSSSDKTFYREEVEEVTYVYRTPVRSDEDGDRESYLRSRPDWTETEFEHESFYSRSKPEPQMYDTPTTYRNTYLKSTPMESVPNYPKAPKSSRFIPLWVEFVLFLFVAVFLYMVFTNMETNEFFKGIE